MRVSSILIDSFSKKTLIHFNPSLNVLQRVFLVLNEEGSTTRTALSQKANLHYTRLANHLKWLESKEIVQAFYEDGRVRIGYTERGRQFATILMRGRIGQALV